MVQLNKKLKGKTGRVKVGDAKISEIHMMYSAKNTTSVLKNV